MKNLIIYILCVILSLYAVSSIFTTTHETFEIVNHCTPEPSYYEIDGVFIDSVDFVNVEDKVYCFDEYDDPSDMIVNALADADTISNIPGIYHIVSKPFQNLNTSWDKTRYRLWELASYMKYKYPEIPMTTLHLYDSWAKTIYAECKFKTGKRAINPISDARGCIQWLPGLRKKLGVPNNIHTLPLYEQITYVHRYVDYKIKLQSIDVSKLDDFVDIYCIVFAPAMADLPINATVYKSCWRKGYLCEYQQAKDNNWKTKDTKRCAYHANQGYDINNSGNIRKNEIRNRIINKHYIAKK